MCFVVVSVRSDIYAVLPVMLRHGIRRLTTTALRGTEIAAKADMSNQYGVQLAKAQGHVNGFVGGT